MSQNQQIKHILYEEYMLKELWSEFCKLCIFHYLTLSFTLHIYTFSHTNYLYLRTPNIDIVGFSPFIFYPYPCFHINPKLSLRIMASLEGPTPIHLMGSPSMLSTMRM